ncbi:MAG: phospholipase D-like domain-containing protein [Campylobacterota bacterium]|nr:phospholipase D-like domain-containing protein [Campylobacterota bacterium]
MFNKKGLLSFLIVCLVSSFVWAKDEVYLLPNDSKKFYKELKNNIKDANSVIDIAVYNFEYKKVAKLLRKAAKKGVQINIVFDKAKLKKDDTIYSNICDKKNINCVIKKKGKQHVKLIIIDNTTAILGSLNLTEESFKENNELIYITDRQEVLKQLNSSFDVLFK